MKKSVRNFCIAAGFFIAFAVWTLAVCLLDVRPIGPCGSLVGMARLNGAFHAFTGVHMGLYILTDWLGLIPIAVALCFAVLGLYQWIKRKRLCRVDASLFLLGGFYILVFAVYLLFEFAVINRRPVLIDGYLEASYPSSTTLLALCILPSAMLQLQWRIGNAVWRRIMLTLLTFLTAFLVIGRLVCGVHWLSDIIGGVLLSAALLWLYVAFCNLLAPKA